MQSAVASEGYLGAVTLISRNGNIVDWRAYGHRDLARSSPMAIDSIFRIYSMTKTVASVAALMLMEEGKLTLEDPVDKFIPEFAEVKVFNGGTTDFPELRQTQRPITIRHLMTHTAGFATSGDKDNNAVKRFNRFDLRRSPSLKAYVDYVAQQPLLADPGERFNYDGVNTEVLSRLVEVVSGMPFEAFLKQRILVPLKMTDTGFSVAPEKRRRIADMVTTNVEGKLVPTTTTDAVQPGEMLNPYPSGAGGLYSTAGDYLRFCQMLLDGGSLNGVSILGRKTVDLLMANHLTHLDPQANSFSNAEGFGLGGYVVLDVARRGRLGSVGQFGWSGVGSTYFAIDRQEKMVAILMMQHMSQGLPKDPPKLSVKFFNAVYQSLVQ